LYYFLLFYILNHVIDIVISRFAADLSVMTYIYSYIQK